MRQPPPPTRGLAASTATGGRTALLWVATALLLLALLAGPAAQRSSAAVRHDDGPLSAGNGLLSPLGATSAWPSNEITYAIVNPTDDIDEDDVGELIRAAFDRWVRVTPLTFYEVDDPADAQIRISWETDDHGDGNPFDGAGGSFAHTFPPGTSPLSGDIHLDGSETWVAHGWEGPVSSIGLYPVAVHQIGHALGLGHSADPAAVMHDSYTAGKIALGADDISAIQGIYGPNPGPRFFLRNSNDAGVPSVIARYSDPGHFPLVGDWDGDGDDTIGIYDPATRMFHLNDQNDSSTHEHATTYGDPGVDFPLVGDWNGDGKDTIGVYRPSTRAFYLNDQIDTSPPEHGAIYGNPNDFPLVGDWDGDGKDTIGLYRPSTHTFYLNDQVDASPPEHTYAFSTPGAASSDIPVVGDWNGDGVDEVGVINLLTGRWTLRNDHTCCASVTRFPFLTRTSDMFPLAGDWDGDGTATVGMYYAG